MIKNFNLLKFFAAFIAFLLLNLCSTQAQNGPVCDNYNNVAATIPSGLSSDTVYGVYVEGSMVYAATSNGLSISTNGGSSFTAVNDLNYQQVNDVSVSGSTVYAATNNGLYISTDGGATFTFKFSASVYGVYASDSTVYAATNDGLRISTDGGATFTKKTTTNGLGDNDVRGVYASGSTVYAATWRGVSISTNGGSSFTNKTTSNGLGNNIVRDVYASGSTVYAATVGGLSITMDGGTSFINYSTANGLGANFVRGVYVSGTTVYTATESGLSISTDGGTSFTNYTTANGLGSNDVNEVYASGNTVYAATSGGLSISTDGGTTFVNKTSTIPSGSGLGSDNLTGVFANGNVVYVATGGGLSISTNGGASFTNKTTTNGLGANNVNGVCVSGSTIYAPTSGGLSISTDGGASFTNKTTTNGLANDYVTGVFAVGSTIYAATFEGLSISSDGGASFTNRTTTDGLASNYVFGVCDSGSSVYAAVYGGVSISTDGGVSFTNRTTTDGLGSDFVNGVYASGSTVYAATSGGLSISTDGGTSFTNYTTANGLGSDGVNGVYASGNTVYASTASGLSISMDGGATFTNYTTANGLGSNNVSGVYASGNTVFVATMNGLSFCSAAAATPDTPVVSVENNCGTATLSTTATGSLLWSTGATTSSITVSTAGDYTVTQTVSDVASAAGSGTAAPITVPAAPTITAGGETTFCSGGSVVLTASTGTTYLWSNGATTQSITATTAGSYTVQVTNASGCQSVASAATVITVNTTAAPSAIAQTFCTSGTVADLVGTGTYLLWYDVATNGTALASSTALATGNYYVSQTLNGCEGSRTLVAVTVNTTAAPSASAQTFCTSGTVANLVGTGTSLQWYEVPANGTALASSTALATGNYYVSQTLTSCESARTSVVVTVTPKPSAPAKVNSWDNFVFNTTSCAWDNTGTPTNSTTILDSQCGSTLAAISTILSAYPVANATAYKFKIVTSGTNAIRYYSSSTGSFNLTQVTGSLYNTTYTLSVAATIGGVLKAYGATCTVTTPTVPLSKVQDSQCGVTLAALSTVIVPVAVPLAQAYKYKVTNIATNAVNYYTRSKTATFALSQRADAGSGSVAIKLSSTYSVAVAVKINGVFSAYGDACLVSTPLLPTTKIHDALCGTTLASINSYLYLKAGVAGSTGYRLKATQGNEVRTCDRTVVNMYYPFEFKQLTGGAAYATTYELSVSVFYNGAWQPYGATCTVTTPAAPQSKLAISQCGITLNKTNTNVLTASSVAVAQAYRFEVSKGTSTYTVETTSGSLRTFKLTEVPGLTLESGATYGIRVAIKANGVWQPYGASCNVTTYGSPAIGKMADPLAKPETVFNALAYPNPFSSAFQLKLDTSSKAAVDLEVYDVLGRLIENRQWNGAETTEQEMGNNYPSGIYNIILNQGENVKTLRVIKR